MFHLFTSIYTDLTQRPRFNILFVGSAESGKTTLLQTFKAHYNDTKGTQQTPPRTPQPSSTLPKTRPTVGQNVLDIPSPLPSSRPLILPAYPPPRIPSTPPPSSSSSSWFSSSRNSNIPQSPQGPRSARQPSKAVLHIWDLGGEKGLRSIWKEYYGEVDCVVYFWDCGKASHGEVREEEWQTLLGLAQEPQLSHLPFLVILSRSDLTASQRQADIKGKGKELAEDDAQATLDDEEGDLSLSVSSSAGSIDGIASQEMSRRTSQQSATQLSESQNTAADISITSADIPNLQAPPPMDGPDVLESLRMFIFSNIEAYTSRQSSQEPPPPVAASQVDQDLSKSEQDTDEAGDDSDLIEHFPETTILPVSSLTGKGIVECMDWFVHKSIGSTRRAT
ncbi:unnamed protein product [Sympodiomycopsis kandeliae]